MLLVGLDAASQRSSFGYALGTLSNGQITVDRFGLLNSKDEPNALARIIAPAIAKASRALIGIDAPLGWPQALAPALMGHSAGTHIGADKDTLFARVTDRVVREAIKKKPLEVAADKIARAAHTALEVLGELRRDSKKPLPLAWTKNFDGCAVIEVYPGATLKARGLADSGYKKSDVKERKVRAGIADALKQEIPRLAALVDEPADTFDACLCLVAAKDFLECEVLEPTNLEVAKREGWIWVRRLP